MIKILALAILGFFIAEWFKPIQWIKDKLKLYKYWWSSWLYCVKCTCFWLGLLFTLNLESALIISILGYTISYLIDLMEKHRYEK